MHLPTNTHQNILNGLGSMHSNCTYNGFSLLLPNVYLTTCIGSLDISDTISCFRLDGFPQPMWTKRECSEEPTFADLAPYKSGTIFYLLCSEKRTHSLQEINIRQKKCFCCFVLSGYSFFSECFYPVSLSSIMHQLCFCLCCVWILEDVLFNFCTGTKEKKLARCLCAFAEALLNRGLSRD